MDAENSSGNQKTKRNVQLRRARAVRLWTIKMAAKELGVSETTYIRWEQGEQLPHLVNLQMLCNTFDSTPDKLGYGDVVDDGEIEISPKEEENTELERLLVIERQRRIREVHSLRQEIAEAEHKQSQLEGRLTFERNRRLRAQRLLDRYAENTPAGNTIQEETL